MACHLVGITSVTINVVNTFGAAYLRLSSTPIGPLNGRLVGSGPRLGLGVTNELVIKLRECARPRLRDESLR